MKLLRLVSGLLLAALGTLALGAARLPAAPDLFLVPVADAARGGAPLLAMFTGLAAGLMEDTLTVPGRLLGLHAFTKILIGYMLATLGARTVVDKPATVGGLLGGAVLIESALLVLLLWVLRGETFLPSPAPLVARATTTGLVGAALQAAARFPWRARREARRRRRLTS